MLLIGKPSINGSSIPWFIGFIGDIGSTRHRQLPRNVPATEPMMKNLIPDGMGLLFLGCRIQKSIGQSGFLQIL